jgi:hypothetical protein
MDIRSTRPQKLNMYFKGFGELQILKKYSKVKRIVKAHSTE